MEPHVGPVGRAAPTGGPAAGRGCTARRRGARAPRTRRRAATTGRAARPPSAIVLGADGRGTRRAARRCASSAAAAARGWARGVGPSRSTRSRWFGSHDAASRSFMRCEPNCAELHRVHETRRRLRRPRLDGRRRRQPVEGVVELDGVEQRRVVARTSGAAGPGSGTRRRASPGTPSPSSRPARFRTPTSSRGSVTPMGQPGSLRLPGRAGDLAGRRVQPVPEVDARDREQQRRQLLLVVVAAASSHTSSGTGSARSLSRVTASVSASAARSASVKYGASRHAATANRRSSVSPRLLAGRGRACRRTRCSR